MSSLTLAQASHLARRGGFSASSQLVTVLQSASSQETAIDTLLALTSSVIELPEWSEQVPFGRSDDEQQRKENQQTRNRWGRELKYCWPE